MKKIHKISAIITAAITVVTATGAISHAANTADVFWKADYDNSWYCYWGRKENSTSIYVKNLYYPTNEDGNPVTISVYAADKYGNAYYNEKYAYKYGRTTLKTTDLFMDEGVERTIHSFIYENLHAKGMVPMARIEFKSWYGNARGWWSPDTAWEWNYTCLNPWHY
jgi:hypothetical protein